MTHMLMRQDDDLLITPVTRRRMQIEGQFQGGPGVWWGALRRTNGDVHLRNNFIEAGLAAQRPPLDMQQVFARDMVDLLNREIHHDGGWIVIFTHPSIDIFVDEPGHTQWTRWAFLWLDEDGDVQFTLDNESPFGDVLAAGPGPWIEQSEAAWQSWYHHMRRVLDIKPGERGEVLYRRAQGERRPSGNKPLRPLA